MLQRTSAAPLEESSTPVSNSSSIESVERKVSCCYIQKYILIRPLHIETPLTTVFFYFFKASSVASLGDTLELKAAFSSVSKGSSAGSVEEMVGIYILYSVCVPKQLAFLPDLHTTDCVRYVTEECSGESDERVIELST